MTNIPQKSWEADFHKNYCSISDSRGIVSGLPLKDFIRHLLLSRDQEWKAKMEAAQGANVTEDMVHDAASEERVREFHRNYNSVYNHLGIVSGIPLVDFIRSLLLENETAELDSLYE